MRIEGQTKIGFYATPPAQLSLILTWLKAGAGIRWLDPCCGKGEALALLAKATKGESYGIELSDPRAEEAKAILNHVLCTGFEFAVLTRGTFSAVLLNPPYDGETSTGGGTRLEETFLKNATPLLTAGGVMIYIIPHKRVTEVVARHLAGWYDSLRCFKFAGEDFDDFGQVIILGRRASAYKNPTDRAVAEILAWADLQTVTGWQKGAGEDKQPIPVLAALPEILPGNGEYTLPSAPERGDNGQAFRFKFQPIAESDYARMAVEAVQKLTASKAWLALRPPLDKEPITPAISPNLGHISMQVTAGLLGTARILHNGSPLLLKGSLRKKTLVIQGDQIAYEMDGGVEDQDKEHMKRVDVEERFEPVITTLAQDGTLQLITDPTEVTAALKLHITELVEIVEQRNIPLYRRDPEAWEWEAASRLSQGRAWPGQPPGFSEPQKHVVIAGARTALARQSVFPVIEMGGGKTGMGLGIVDLLHQHGQRQGHAGSIAYPVLVAAPGMVTSDEANWGLETPQIVAGAIAKTCRIAARPLPKPARIGEWVKTLGIPLSKEDEEKLGDLPADILFATLQTMAQTAGVPLADSDQLVLKAALKEAEKNPPPKRPKARLPNLLDGRIGGYLWLEKEMPRDENSAADNSGKYSLAQFMDDYKAGRLPQKSVAVISYETAKLGPGRLPAYILRSYPHQIWDNATEQFYTERRTLPCCPICGAPIAEAYDLRDGSGYGLPEQNEIVGQHKIEEYLATNRRFCRAPQVRQVRNPDSGEWEETKFDKNGERLLCGAPLFEYSGLRRASGIALLKKKGRGFFKTAILDELHKAKSKGTGVGHVMAVLAGICKYKIGLTGTLFGGYSTSIFWLLYRILASVRQNYGFEAELAWATDMGLIKRSFYVNPNAAIPEDGTFTGRRFFETVDERPGISPQIARYVLPICIFASLTDMGLPLPTYSEEIVRLDMTPDMRAQYEVLDGSPKERGQAPGGLLAWALEEQKTETGKGAIGVWWTTIFNRPNAMFRTDQVTFNRRLSGRGRFAKRSLEIVTTAPAVTGGLLPKEEWLVNMVKAQKAAGRKVMVYVRQTGERDIQEHLKELVQSAGLRVEIMKPSIAPSKRIVWLQKNVGKFDVLITNPRLVEVGLNLTMLPTAVFFEIEPSFYTLYQAMKRVHRPFAPKPVQVYFAVYNDTAEDTILDVMCEKFLSNQLLTGQEVGGALTPDDAGSVLQVAINRILSGESTVKARGLFATQNDSTASPLGSPTVSSPVMRPSLSWSDWTMQHSAAIRPAARRKQKPASQNQLGLFG
jgi:hypothetical protein